MSKRPATQSTNAPVTLGPRGRAVGLDIHPDSFAAAILQGRDPFQARVLHSITRQPLDGLSTWTARQTTPEDVLLIEASANTFTIAERLRAVGRQRRVARTRPRQPAGAPHPGQQTAADHRQPAAEVGSLHRPALRQNKAAVAVARKLTVAVWHVLQGHWNKALEESTTLLTKLSKLAIDLGLPTLRELGYTSKAAFQEQKLEVLRTYP